MTEIAKIFRTSQGAFFTFWPEGNGKNELDAGSLPRRPAGGFIGCSAVAGNVSTTRAADLAALWDFEHISRKSSSIGPIQFDGSRLGSTTNGTSDTIHTCPLS